MRYLQPIRFAAHRGFTLVETIMVLVVLGIAAVTIVKLQGGIISGQANNETIQVGVQLMQECAEQVLATSRAGNFNSVTSPAFDSTHCGGMTAFGGYSIPGVTITPGNSTTANMGACPYDTGTDCKLVKISQGGLTEVTLMLVKY